MNPILDAPVTEQKLEYAGFWIRVVANIIDSIVLCVVLIAIGFVFIGGAFATAGSDDGAAFGFLAAIYLMYFVIVFGYFAVMESSTRQATLGKMAVGIKVGDERGQRISTMNALGRNLGKILSQMILYIGYIMVAFDARKQGLHDKLAGTVVYYG
jgi:uncharacterized RDD family membrane protein YckC